MSSDTTTVALACQGGGAHSAFCAGALQRLLTGLPDGYEVLGFSGASGGALCATTAWYGYATGGPERAVTLLGDLWTDVAATTPTERAVDAASQWRVALDASGLPVPEVSPYLNPWTDVARGTLRRWIEGVVDFDRVPALAAGESTRLLVSAVDVLTGAFRVFTGADVTVGALLASTAVPGLFEAATVDGRPYWDGLFAQNPPVGNFLAGIPDADRKPDEIWLLRVTPERRERVPTSLSAIADRRTELSGSLALRQELGFVERVNDWVESGVLPGDRYKRVAVEQVRPDENWPLSSRFDRSPAFVESLLEAGRDEAEGLLDEKRGG